MTPIFYVACQLHQGQSIINGNYFFLAKNVATQEISIHIERMWHIPVNAAIRWALHTVSTCRRQVNQTPTESLFYCRVQSEYGAHSTTLTTSTA
jgi:hypothetical protein